MVVGGDFEVVDGVRHEAPDAVPRLRQQVVGHCKSLDKYSVDVFELMMN